LKKGDTVSSFLQLFHPFPNKVVSGREIYLTLDNGKEYMDLFAGLGVNLLGHNHPDIRTALSEPFPMHLSALIEHPLKEEVASDLTRITGFDKVFFSNSGTEAIEGAIKFIWLYLIRRGQTNNRIISFRESFHGRTLGSLSLTDLLQHQKVPMLDIEKVFLPFGDTEILTKEIQKGCGFVIIEPIQGAGGVKFGDDEFYTQLEILHKEFGFGLIVDEIQSGLGRTGEFLASTHYDLNPDIVTLAKGLGGGLPLGAILLTEQVANSIKHGDHGTTMGGNYLALRLAKVVIPKVQELLEHVRNLDTLLKDILVPQLAKNKNVKEVRHKGLFIAIELKKDKSDEVKDILYEKGYLVNSIKKRIIRLLPPLIIRIDELKEAFEQIDEVVEVF
jgi:acetylornithine/N-succinyldiaminopimelate aminotransferase